jgi:creatinine amidohydrolase
LAVAAVLAAGWLLGFAGGQAGPAGKATAVTSGGYSVFHETMVDMTWPEVEKAAKEGAVVLMTTAVIEEHGPHMSCGIDAYGGYLMCKLTRRELETRGVKAVIAPPFYWGINGTSHVFPGTFTVRPETMKAVLLDMLSSLKAMGFKHVFNINAHGDGLHIRTAVGAIIEARKTLDLEVRYLMAEEDAKRSGLAGDEPFLLIHKSPPSGGESQEYLDLHAGAAETGLIAAYFPSQVNVDLARTLQPTKVTVKELGEWAKDMKKVTPQGYLGDPAKLDASKAQRETEDSCRLMADAIAGFLRREEHRKKLSQLDYDALERKRDDKFQQYRLLDVGGVKPGMIIGEVGAGDGYLTFHLAARVGATGRIYANDIVEEMALEVVRARAMKKGITNIETILGTDEDPRFPKASLDLVFFLNSFHEVRKPVELLGNLVASLKSGAKVIIHEWEAETPKAIGPSGDRTYTRQEFLDIIARSPFTVVNIDTSFPGPHSAAYVLILKDQASSEPASTAILKELQDLQASLR